jgi:hypothetical protein
MAARRRVIRPLGGRARRAGYDRPDVDWTAVTALAAVIAAVGAIGALLATTLQLHQERLAREVDYYRKLTPFLSFEVSSMAAPAGKPGEPWPLAVEVYADGGGYAFNVEANIDQTNASVGGGARLSGQKVIRYLREGLPSPGYIDFSKAGDGFRGDLKVTFIDTFGIKHEARQAVRVGAGDRLETTDAIKWGCGPDCRVHVIRPVPPPGLLPRLGEWLRLY